MNWAAFFAMGGYAVYVWPSYALAAFVLVLTWVVPHWRERRLLRAIARQTNPEER